MLRIFRANPVTVFARAIMELIGTGEINGSQLVRLEDGTDYFVTAEMMARMRPALGDYVVIAPNPDGSSYEYLNPKAVFEAKYTEITNANSVPAKKEASPVPPTQGRIVIYHHPGSADGKYPPQTSPAIIQQVDQIDPNRCLLFVFGPKGQHMDWSDYGEGPCQWSWPTRG